MEMMCDLCEVGTEFMCVYIYIYTDKFNECHSFKGYEINCVMDIHMNPLQTTWGPTTHTNSGISPSLYEDVEKNAGSCGRLCSFKPRLLRYAY
jgi:hypothetical protein